MVCLLYMEMRASAQALAIKPLELTNLVCVNENSRCHTHCERQGERGRETNLWPDNPHSELCTTYIAAFNSHWLSLLTLTRLVDKTAKTTTKIHLKSTTTTTAKGNVQSAHQRNRKTTRLQQLYIVPSDLVPPLPHLPAHPPSHSQLARNWNYPRESAESCSGRVAWHCPAFRSFSISVVALCTYYNTLTEGILVLDSHTGSMDLNVELVWSSFAPTT